MTGVGSLIRLILRRDRLLLPVWILGLAAITSSTAAGVLELYSTEAARREWASGIAGNPMELALVGPIFGDSAGAITSWQVGVRSLLGAALAGLLTVVRHTRAEEDSGRREMLGSTAVGRHAQLVAALIVSVVACCLTGLLTALALTGAGLPGGGSLALGLAIASVGCVCAGIGAVTAQASESAGGARGIGLIVLAVAYVLRALGDASGGALSWLSPLGWAHRVRPFAGEQWPVLLLPAAATLALAGVAVALSARRDLGAGLLPVRPGPATASPALRGPFSLAWRLHRTTLTGWVIGFCCAGAVLGGIAQSVTGQAGQSRQLQDLIDYLGGGGRPVDGVFALFLYILALAAAAYGVQVTLRARTEELAGRAEPMLATPIGRLRWLGAHLLVAAAGSAAILAALGLSGGLIFGLTSGNVAGEVPRLLGGALVYLPAVWIMIGVATLLYGLVPRAAVAGAWGILVLNVLVFLLAQLPGVDDSIASASPFIEIPKLPAAALSAAPLLILPAIAAVLTVAGMYGFRRRHLA
ncbi:ABC transporter permease [Nonomuraea insulae]|uniref:ABC transporter permease n=1 Tax=Nonomuraea insulae TaxID=1616787 RepID=A0ABW1DEN0_9ACTN